MRLRDIKKIIEENIDGVKMLKVHGIKNQPEIKKLTNVTQAVTALKMIETSGIFKDQFNTLKKEYESLFLSVENSISLPKTMTQQLQQWIAEFITKLNTVILVIDDILVPQKDLSISIKLPRISQLKDLSVIINKLDKIFDQLLSNNYVKGKVEFQNFDNGSEWIEIFFNSAKALGLFSSVILTAILLKREQIKNKEAKEVVRNRKITNDILEKMGIQMNSAVEKLLNYQIELIIQDSGVPKNDNEYSERIKFCINEVSNLIDKGIQFFPASKAPSEIKSVFPDFTEKEFEKMLPKVTKLPESTKVENKDEEIDD